MGRKITWIAIGAIGALVTTEKVKMLPGSAIAKQSVAPAVRTLPKLTGRVGLIVARELGVALRAYIDVKRRKSIESSTRMTPVKGHFDS